MRFIDEHGTELGIAAAFAAAAGLMWRKEIANTVADVWERGARLTRTSLNADGYIDDDPEALAEQAAGVFGSDFSGGGFSLLDVYALARMSRSEADARDGTLSRKVRMHVALNDFREVSWAHLLADVFLYSNNAEAKGHFGRQNGRRYATTLDPYVGDIKLAIEVIGEDAAGEDPSGGAVKFVDAAAMGGVQAGTGTFDALVARWAKEGLTPYNVEGLSDDFYVFRRDG